MWIARGTLQLAVLGCVVASTTLAFRYGWTRSVNEFDQWTFAGAAAALDLVKTGLPIVAATTWAARECGKAVAAWLGFIFLTLLSLWCAFGMTATQLADKGTAQTVAKSTYDERKADLERLTKERAELPKFQPRTATAEAAAREAVERAEASVTAECRKRGPLCRDLEAIEREKRDELATISADVATAKRADDLNGKIAAAQAKLDSTDRKTASKETDPQSASLAKITGTDQGVIAAAAHVFLALGIEFGSGLGFWLAFGHGGGGRREPVRDLGPSPTVAALPSPEPLDVETPSDAIERFFVECVRPTLGQRVRASAMMAAYEQWCGDRGVMAVSATQFGRLAGERRRKERVGGAVWYTDVQLVGYGLQIAVDNTAAGARLAQSAA
jgi:hypothetical protein